MYANCNTGKTNYSNIKIKEDFFSLRNDGVFIAIFEIKFREIKQNKKTNVNTINQNK